MRTLCDEVLVISLPERVDRRERICKVLQDQLIPFRFLDGIKVSLGEVTELEVADLCDASRKSPAGADAFIAGMVGSKRAHIRALQYAETTNFDSVLIFEDDIGFHEGWFDVYRAALSELPDEWLQLYLSAEMNRPAFPISAHLARLTGALDLIAVLYSKNGIEASLRSARTARYELGAWFSDHLHPFGCSYVVTPQITYEEAGFSDVHHAHHPRRA